MTATYATEAKVVSFLQLSSAKATELNTEIGYAIERAQDEIDRYTNSAWRSVTVSNEYHNIGPWVGNNGNRIRLNHRHNKALSNTGGNSDKLEVWNGSAYEDFVATKTLGRADDYWQEENEGVVWIRSGLVNQGGSEVRVTYRYGNATVPADIERACILLAAVDLITSDDRSVILPESGAGSSLPFAEKARLWKERAYHILDGYREFYPVDK